MVDKLLEAVAKFRDNFEFIEVYFLGVYLKFIISSKFETFEKYCLCAFFCQICSLENFNVGKTF